MKNRARKSITLFCAVAFFGSIVASLFADCFIPDIAAIVLLYVSRSPNKKSQRSTYVLVTLYVIASLFLAGYALLDPTSVDFGSRQLTPQEGSWVATYMGVLAVWSIINATLLYKEKHNNQIQDICA